MILQGTMSISTSYAIFMGEIAGVRALERHECGVLGSAFAIDLKFSVEFFKGCGDFF